MPELEFFFTFGSESNIFQPGYPGFEFLEQITITYKKKVDIGIIFHFQCTLYQRFQCIGEADAAGITDNEFIPRNVSVLIAFGQWFLNIIQGRVISERYTLAT